MTPAIKALEKARITFEIRQYTHDGNSESYGEEAAKALGLSPAQVFKTLLTKLDDSKLAVAIIPVSGQLDLKALARVAGARKAAMANPDEAQRATGYVLGGISPLGQKKRLPTFIDTSAETLSAIHVSAGRRGLEVSVSPVDLASLLNARFAELSRT
ncbi:Cys-tRNA(Pro) deacylase [Halomonas halocynthiae]|uniref:Cys-tRNA(Pro) deacylase n=1 Tax=Halomonas halocynthiae TaxID=176290 RepID=UPI0003FB7662|nr:Cys-tRNA(Pro) deacylase [Halomonas halocynthiae]